VEECELCAQPVSVERVIERPSAGEIAYLTKFFWVIDPARLVFCNAICRRRWHSLRRRATWMAHSADCMCAECL